MIAGSATAAADASQACIEASDQGQLLRIDKRLREAREQFVRCAQEDCPSMVRESCVRWLDETGRAIPAIAFAVHDSTGSDVSGVRIAVDGVLVTERYDGTALPLDPGEHAFHFSSADGASVDRTFRLTQGDQERREPIVLETHSRRAPVSTAHRSADAPTSSSPLRTWGFVMSVAGVAGLLTGGVFGTLAIVQNDSAHCDAQNVCGDAQARRDAQRSATASTVAFAAGAALAAGGLGLVLLGGRHASARIDLSPVLTAHTLGLGLGAAW